MVKYAVVHMEIGVLGPYRHGPARQSKYRICPVHGILPPEHGLGQKGLKLFLLISGDQTEFKISVIGVSFRRKVQIGPQIIDVQKFDHQKISLYFETFHLDPCFFGLEAIDNPKEHFQQLPFVPFDTFLLILTFDGLYKFGEKPEPHTFDKKVFSLNTLDLAHIKWEAFHEVE